MLRWAGEVGHFTGKLAFDAEVNPHGVDDEEQAGSPEEGSEAHGGHEGRTTDGAEKVAEELRRLVIREDLTG